MEFNALGSCSTLLSLSISYSLFLIPQVTIALFYRLSNRYLLGYLFCIVLPAGIFIFAARELIFHLTALVIVYKIVFIIGCICALFFSYIVTSIPVRLTCAVIGLGNGFILSLGVRSNYQGVIAVITLALFSLFSFALAQRGKGSSLSPRILSLLYFWPSAQVERSIKILLVKMGNFSRELVWPLAVGIQLYPIKALMILLRLMSRPIHNGSAQRPVFFILGLSIFALIYFA